MAIRVTAAALLGAALLAFAPSALAYDEVGNPPSSECETCHDPTSGSAHSGYATTSRVCVDCHTVHGAEPEGYLLLPGPTITDTCNLCHDGTGGEGVYGVLEARLGPDTVESAHRTDTTATVPGGDLESGEATTLAFGGLGGTLSCGDCHSPHGADVVEEFTGDRVRINPGLPGYTSTRLLRRQPGGTQSDVAVYGSDWCAACHAGRISGSHEGTDTVFNHPVESGASTSSPFTYQNLQVVTGVNSTQTASGRLGRSNYGYVMPWPRTSGQGDHLPICQQCHEDGRNVGNSSWGQIASDEVFQITSVDGSATTDNPRFQVFPHESATSGLLIETDDSLCTNCHSPDQLD